MATSVDDADYDIDITKIPIIDFRSFCQDEIRCVAQLSGDCSDERLQDIVNVAIDKTIFNESLGSRRQTYARDRIPRRAHHLHATDLHSKPRLVGSPEKPTSPGEQIQRSSSTDSKDKRSYRENQELIARICRQMQQPLLADGDSFFNVSKDCDTGSQAGAKPHAKKNAVFPAFKHFRTTIIAGGQLISVIEPRRDETHGQKRRHQSKTKQSEGQVINEGSIAGLVAATGAKKLKVDNGREDSIRLKRIARGNLTEGQGAATNGRLLKENSPERSHRLSKKIKTKEEARRRATTGSDTELRVPVDLDKVRLSSPGNGDNPAVRMEDRASQVQKPVDFKLMDAEGFPHGWKVCVALKKRRTGMTAKIIKFVSPDGQEWFSHKEALRHAGSVAGINGSSQIGSGLKPSELALTCFEGPNGHKTDASEVLEPRNAATIVKLNKIHAARHALCTTCGKTFTTQYSLRRHLSSQGHGTDQASGAVIEQNPHRKVKGAEVSSKNNLKIRQQRGLSTVSGDARQETATALEEKVGTIKGKIANSNKKTYKCKTCAKIVKSRKKYLTHLKVHSLKAPQRSKVRGFECRPCKLRFKRRRQYVDHLNTHSKKGRKKAGRPSSRKAGRPVGRPPVKVLDKPVTRIPKPKRPGQSSAVSAEKKISFPKSKFDIEKTLKWKSSRKEFLCDKCGAVFGHHIAYIGHQIVHSKKKNKRKHGQEDYSRQERFCEEGFDAHAQATAINISTFPCQVCGEVFNEYFRYRGHLNVHSKRRKMAYRGLPSIGIRETKNSSCDGAVNYDNDHGNSFCSQESLTSVLRKLLADTTGTCLPGLPAKLLFSSNVETFELMKETKAREKEKTLAGSYQGGGVCSTSQAEFSQGGSKMVEGSRLTGDMQFRLNNELLEGWSAGGCSICGNISADSAERVVCNWCDREFHESCLMQQCLGLSASWVCPSCRTSSRVLER